MKIIWTDNEKEINRDNWLYTYKGNVDSPIPIKLEITHEDDSKFWNIHLNGTYITHFLNKAFDFPSPELVEVVKHFAEAELLCILGEMQEWIKKIDVGV